MKKIILFFRHPLVRNKYSITVFVIITWMFFFDQNDFISQIRLRNELRLLEEDKKYFIEEIEATKTNLEELMTDPAKLERYAREKYLMKKDDEDIFVIYSKKR